METIRRKTKKEIIDETVAFYSEDTSRRATNIELIGGISFPRCKYLTEDGRMCAVGRCLIPDGKIRNYGNDYSYEIAMCTSGQITNLEEILKPEYRGHDIGFWRDLQNFHDDNENAFWNEDGITEIGLNFVESLHLKYPDE